MSTRWTFLVAPALMGITVLSVMAMSPDPQPAVVHNLSGTLRIQQALPCSGSVDHTTPVTGGRLELTPAEGIEIPSGKSFSLTRASVAFAPFSVSGSCLGLSETRHFTEAGVQLVRAAPFTATAAGTGLFNVTIPKGNLLFEQSTIVNGVRELGYLNPSQDVTGTLDFDHNTVTMHVVIATRVRFQGGCVGSVCAINEELDGVLTADISGVIAFPDADGDSVPDRSDNCRFVPNPTQTPVATPAITPPADLTLASCADRTIGFATAVDRCDAGTVAITHDAPGTFATGGNVVTWRAQDGQGRATTSPQHVSVVDTTNPAFTFVPAAIEVNDCGPVSLGVPEAADDCAGTPALANDAPASFDVGPTIVTWTAIDASGNRATATQTVTVTDRVAPSVSCTPAGPPGGVFLVKVADGCSSTPPTVRIGTFVLQNGERIKIEEVGGQGVELVGVVGPEKLRHFHAAQAVITATDGSGNVTTAICR